MQVSEAFRRIGRAIDSGKPAHGYLLCGDLHGQCDVLTMNLLKKLFPDEISQVEKRSHPDVAWLEAEGKSRTIHVKSMREKIVAPMSVTAFSGGWKVGVIIGADRMETEAANAFLKTLEEPPAHAIFILATTELHKLPSTIVSRCQRHDFRRIATDTLVSRLAYISDAEGIGYDTDALRIIAKMRILGRIRICSLRKNEPPGMNRM